MRRKGHPALQPYQIQYTGPVKSVTPKPGHSPGKINSTIPSSLQCHFFQSLRFLGQGALRRKGHPALQSCQIQYRTCITGDPRIVMSRADVR